MTLDEGERLVGARELWNHEEHDFTPWLANHLHLLGNEIGLTLELVARERPVGPFSLDILAKEPDTGVLVAIENQLEWTDFQHFGQLLTYATGSKAQVVIWVAPVFRYEHAQALHRLNEWTVDGVRFYGVKVEAVLSGGDSAPRPRFRKVVYPGGWNKEQTWQSGSVSPESLLYQDFFEPMIAELLSSGPFDRLPIQRWGPSGRYFLSPINAGTWYAIGLGHRPSAWVCLHIETDGKDKTKRIFDALLEDRPHIEAAIPAEPSQWSWSRHDRWNYSSVFISIDASIADPPEKQKATKTWMLSLLPKFQQHFDPRIKAILDDLEDNS
ncbi:MAG: DUF4268 domain-containing protein [bacterium]|nr:DUF4268 domain-containing protein [bacterium]